MVDKKIVYRWASVTNVIFLIMLVLPMFTDQNYNIPFYVVLLLGIVANGVLIMHSYKNKRKSNNL
ncbi:MAG: hypothetical protein LKF36_13860 [Lactobacillus sp.]|nr:hypothetical protein [Lactobacillus sp.]